MCFDDLSPYLHCYEPEFTYIIITTNIIIAIIVIMASLTTLCKQKGPRCGQGYH
jgi:ABC-type transport system involved in cytochrome bd biosynthesis fused ATPase/permease subunit